MGGWSTASRVRDGDFLIPIFHVLIKTHHGQWPTHGAALLPHIEKVTRCRLKVIIAVFHSTRVMHAPEGTLTRNDLSQDERCIYCFYRPSWLLFCLYGPKWS